MCGCPGSPWRKKPTAQERCRGYPLNRLTGKSYSNGDPSVSYFFDQTSYNGLTISNGKSRRTGMSDGSGQTAWSYDAMGRVLTEKGTISSITKSISYAYNLDGSVASVTYPSGRVISYEVTGAGLPTYAKDLANGINYALSATYAPQGGLAGMLNGQTGTFGGITWGGSYNNRLLPTSFTATSTNGTALNLAFSYLPNANVQTVTNNRNTNRTQSFTYDNLNRLATAQSQATSGADCWGQSIPTDGTGYDRWGNLLKINVSKCSAPSLNVSVNSKNQITNTGFTYDAPGNMTADGTYNYVWDDEGRLTSAGGATYTYDGDGRRVKKSSGTLYWYGAGAVPLAETDLSGNTANEYIFFAGARIARRDGSGNVYYYFADHLGSLRTISDSAGAVCYEADFYPFGGEQVITNSCAQNYKFAGMERDSETGNDHTWFRYYASNLGRWLSPDPAAGDITNPQSLNRYAYVLNNPTSVIDPLGLDGDDDCTYDPDTHNLTCPMPPDVPLAGAEYPNCVAYGTEGCIAFPCAVRAVPGCSGPPAPAHPTVPSGGGSAGSQTQTANGQKSKCPGNVAATVNRALVRAILGPLSGLLELPKLGGGGVVGVGLGGTYAAGNPIAGRMGFYGSLSVMVYADSHGNLALGVSPSGGRAGGSGYVVGGQFSTAPLASTVWDMGGASWGISGGGGTGAGGAVERTSSAGGTYTVTLGGAAGGWAAAGGGGTSLVATLACGPD